MKYVNILMILLFSSVLFLNSCKESTTQEKKQEPPQPLDFSNTGNQNTDQSAANTSGVYHYTCSNGCAGGSSSAGTCANCGNTLAHNAAYHSNTNTNTTPDPLNPVTPPTGQNNSGQFHYTCSNGCAGGSASAGTCSSCGSDLAHNSAYHQ